MPGHGGIHGCGYVSCVPRKKIIVRTNLKRSLKRPFIAEWRKHRRLSQEQLAARVEYLLDSSFSSSTLSRIENAKGPYNQRQLEAMAVALECGPADLIMRNPLDPEAPWGIWDDLKPGQKRQVAEMIRIIRDGDKAA